MFENDKGLAAPVTEDWLRHMCGDQKVTFGYVRRENLCRPPRLLCRKECAHLMQITELSLGQRKPTR